MLCIDTEGGHGGSSRSLFTAIKGMDRSDISIEVICRRKSNLVSQYSLLDVACSVCPELPKHTALNSWVANIPSLLKFYFIDFPKTKGFRNKLLKKCERFDVLHANHISLSPLLGWIRKHNPKIKIITHIRTNPKDSVFTRYEARQCLAASNTLVFISENEKAHFEHLVGHRVDGRIIFNPVFINNEQSCPVVTQSDKHALRILSLSNYSFSRGVDRLLEIAEMTPFTIRKEIAFFVAGNMRDTSFLGLVNPWKISFQEKVRRSSVREMFYFFGHVENPDELLKSCNILMKLTRDNNPWGRDIIEALASGLAVVSIGKYDKFVKNNETGLLQELYEPTAIVEWLQELIADQTKIKIFSANAKQLADKHCSVETSSPQLKAVWREISNL